MNVMVMNCGSSSLKYRVISMPEEKELAGGEAQRVGPKTAEPACIYHREKGEKTEHYVEMADHGEAFGEVMKLLGASPGLAPDALGHRMVHGGSVFKDHALIDEKAMQSLEEIQDLAPLHNPPAVALLKACARMYPELPQSAVFDTSYHSSIPEYAYSYALPDELREKRGVRKYGFHGTSHQYVVGETARLMGVPLEEFSAVSCHLGSGGASLCAVKNGRSVDNTMGYSPLQGLMMSSRSGDLDPAVALRLIALSGGDAASVEKRLNKKSGVLGLSGATSDIRDVFAGMKKNDPDSERLRKTASLYLWRIRKYLGAYLAVVGDADAVIFTDTIGETMPAVRAMVCADMENFGIVIDPEKNESDAPLPLEISAGHSPVRVFAVRTNEELAIARQTWRLLNENGAAITARN